MNERVQGDADLAAMLMGSLSDDDETPPPHRSGAELPRRPVIRSTEERGGGGMPRQHAAAPKAAVAKPLPKMQRVSRNAFELGVILVTVAFITWVVNADYTAKGAVYAANFVFSWLALPFEIPMISGLASVFIGVLLGVIISRAQIVHFPIWRKGSVNEWNGLPAVISWVLISAADIFSTAWGYTQLAPDAWPIHVSLSQIPLFVAVWSIVLAFAPEMLFIGGWKLMGWRLPRWIERS